MSYLGFKAVSAETPFVKCYFPTLSDICHINQQNVMAFLTQPFSGWEEAGVLATSLSHDQKRQFL